MKINANFSFKKRKSDNKSLAKHITRDKNYVKNPNVSYGYSRYNYYKNLVVGNYIGRHKGTFSDMERLKHQYDIKLYGGYLKKRNAKYKNRPSRQKTLKQFLSSKPKQKRVVEFLITLGSSKDRAKIDKKVFDYELSQGHQNTQKFRDKFRKKMKIVDCGLMVDELHTWNKRHLNTPVIAYGVNQDETKRHLGADHTHGFMYANSVSPGGKPSSNIDRAIQVEVENDIKHSEPLQQELHIYPNKNGKVRINHKKALSVYSELEDKHLIGVANKVYKKYFGIDLHLTYRPHHNKFKDLSMTQFKAYMTQKDHLAKHTNRVKSRNQSVIKREQTYAKRYRSKRSYYQSGASSASNTMETCKSNLSSYRQQCINSMDDLDAHYSTKSLNYSSKIYSMSSTADNYSSAAYKVDRWNTIIKGNKSLHNKLGVVNGKLSNKHINLINSINSLKHTKSSLKTNVSSLSDQQITLNSNIASSSSSFQSSLNSSRSEMKASASTNASASASNAKQLSVLTKRHADLNNYENRLNERKKKQIERQQKQDKRQHKLDKREKDFIDKVKAVKKNVVNFVDDKVDKFIKYDVSKQTKDIKATLKKTGKQLVSKSKAKLQNIERLGKIAVDASKNADKYFNNSGTKHVKNSKIYKDLHSSDPMKALSDMDIHRQSSKQSKQGTDMLAKERYSRKKRAEKKHHETKQEAEAKINKKKQKRAEQKRREHREEIRKARNSIQW